MRKYLATSSVLLNSYFKHDINHNGIYLASINCWSTNMQKHKVPISCDHKYMWWFGGWMMSLMESLQLGTPFLFLSSFFLGIANIKVGDWNLELKESNWCLMKKFNYGYYSHSLSATWSISFKNDLAVETILVVLFNFRRSSCIVRFGYSTHGFVFCYTQNI